MTRVCSKCNGTGWYYFVGEDGLDYAKPCDCGTLERDKQSNKLLFANIPEAYKDVALRKLSIKYYHSSESKSAFKAACDAVKYWLDKIDVMQEQGRGMYFWSNTKGSGKTMMATALANELMSEYGKTVKFATSLDILEEIRSSYDKESRVCESRLLRDLAEVEILFIDDFGTERSTDWAGEKFYQIVNKRYVNKLITFFTSNYDLKTLKYDDRIANRIVERCFSVHFPEESVREVKAIMENKIGE